MVREALDRLADDLNHWLAAGTVALPVEAVGQHVAVFRKLARQIPALAHLARSLHLLQVAEPVRRTPLLFDLVLLVRQARDALATVGAAGDLVALPSAGPYATPLPADEATDTHNALAWKQKGSWRRIVQAAANGRCADLRLLGPALALLGHVVQGIAALAAEKVLPAFGMALVPELRELDFTGKAAQRWRLRLLCTLDPGAGMEACEVALQQGNDRMVAQALECLTKLLPRDQTIARLVEFLGCRTKAAREMAGKLLASYGAETVPALIERVRGGPTRTRMSAARTLTLLGPHAAPAVDALAEALAEPALAAAAVAALVAVGPAAAPAVPALTEAIRRPEGRAEALRALGIIGRAARSAGQAICTLLRELDPDDKSSAFSWALWALPDIGADVRLVVSTLMHCWEQHLAPGGPSQLLAAALWAVGPDAAPAAPMLLRSLQAGGDPKQREAAITALRGIGPNLRPYLPQLAELARQPASPDPLDAVSVPPAVRILGEMAASADLTEFLPLVLDVIRDPPRDRFHPTPRSSELISTLRVALQILLAQAPLLPREDSWVRQLVPCLCITGEGWLAHDLLVTLDPQGRFALPELLRRAEEPSAGIRHEVIQALKRLAPTCPEALAQLPRFLRDADVWARVNAARALGELGQAAGATAELGRLVSEDPHSEVCQCAVEALYRGTGDADACLALLLPLFDDPARRIDAIGGLKRLGRAAAPLLPRLLEVVHSGSNQEREAAVHALRWVATPCSEAFAVLVPALADANGSVRAEAAVALGELGVATPEVVAGLRRQLWRDKEPFLWAAGALGQLRPAPTEAAPDLLPLLQLPSRYSYTLGALALLRLGQATREALTALCAGPRTKPYFKSDLRYERSLYVFPELEKEQVLPALAAALEDREEAFRCLAAVNLARRREFTARAVEVMAAAVQSDPDDDVLYLRIDAARTLGKLGAAAVVAVPALRSALETVGTWELRRELWHSLAILEHPVR